VIVFASWKRLIHLPAFPDPLCPACGSARGASARGAVERPTPCAPTRERRRSTPRVQSTARLAQIRTSAHDPATPAVGDLTWAGMHRAATVCAAPEPYCREAKSARSYPLTRQPFTNAALPSDAGWYVSPRGKAVRAIRPPNCPTYGWPAAPCRCPAPPSLQLVANLHKEKSIQFVRPRAPEFRSVPPRTRGPLNTPTDLTPSRGCMQ